MKIEGETPNILTPGTDRLDRAGDTSGGTTRRQATTDQADGLHLSPEVQMVQAAVQTAAGLPEIRQDLVDRMRALLERGGVGDDPGRLADALLDRWLTTP